MVCCDRNNCVNNVAGLNNTRICIASDVDLDSNGTCQTYKEERM